MRLSRSDLEGALGFLREAGDCETVLPFPAELLVLLAELIDCQCVNYCESDRIHHKVVFFSTTSEDEADEQEETYWATIHEHPIRRYRTLTGRLDAVKYYDFITPKQLRRTQFYADYLRHMLPSGYLMSVSVPAPQGWSRTFVFERGAADFGERERTLLNLLQPHLLHLRAVVEVRGRARAATQTMPEGLLSERETEVLLHVAEGMRNREIAEALWIAPGTVRKHLDNIYTKLSVHSRAAAVAATHFHADTDRIRSDGQSASALASRPRPPG